MESKNLSFNDQGRNVNITINHYHNNEVRENPINSIFNAFAMWGMVDNLMNLMSLTDETCKEVDQIEDNTKRTIISEEKRKRLLAFQGEAEDVEYSVSEENEKEQEIKTCKFSKLILSPFEKIAIINIEFDENDTSFDKIKENPEKYKSSISYRLSLLNIKTNIFMIKLNDKGIKYNIIFTNNNQCDSILTKYTKNKENKNFVTFNENIFEKFNFEFKDILLENEMEVYIFELNRSFKMIKYGKENEIKYKLEKF